MLPIHMAGLLGLKTHKPLYSTAPQWGQHFASCGTVPPQQAQFICTPSQPLAVIEVEGGAGDAARGVGQKMEHGRVEVLRAHRAAAREA